MYTDSNSFAFCVHREYFITRHAFAVFFLSVNCRLPPRSFARAFIYLVVVNGEWT